MNDSAQLEWSAEKDGFVFSLMDQSGAAVPIERWGLYTVRTIQKTPGSVSPLLALLDGEVVQGRLDDTVCVSHESVAAFDSVQTRQLGLPDPAPLRLKIQGRGILTSPSFRFQYKLVKGDGSAVMGAQRTGSILSIGTRQYLLLNPIFELLEGMDAFRPNATGANGRPDASVGRDEAHAARRRGCG